MRRLLTLASSATLLLTLWPASAVRPRARAAGRRAESATRNAVAETPARLLFTSDRDGNAEVYVKETAAGPEINLTKNPGRDGNPVWSPDGTRVAFTRVETDPSASGGRIYVVNTDGAPAPVAPAIEGVSFARHVDWSPDGAELAFAGTGAQGHGLYRVAAAGGTPTLVHKPAGQSQIDSVDWGAAAQPTVQWRAESFRVLEDGVFGGAAFVDKVLQTAGVQSPNRDSWIADLSQGRKTRAQVLREIVESREVVDRHFNAAFVIMQYFGYLKRDPEITGFNAWLAYLNANPQDFRTMIRGFVRSREYRTASANPRGRDG